MKTIILPNEVDENERAAKVFGEVLLGNVDVYLIFED